MEKLATIEAEADDILESDLLAVHVASALKSGVKDLVFYTREPSAFLRLAERFRESNPEYRVSCEVSPDPSWSHYRDFPSGNSVQ